MVAPDDRDAALRKHPNLAARLQQIKLPIAELVTDALLARHPDWLLRDGERARLRGIEDAGVHIDALAGALESRSIASFEHYAQWMSRVLQARSIDPHVVAECFDQLALALHPYLTEEEIAVVTSVLAAGGALCVIAPVPETEMAPETGLDLSYRLFLQTILAGKRREALTIVLQALRTGQTVTDIYIEIVQESLYEVGRLWETNQITVAEEHMATAIVQYVLAHVYAQLPPAATTRGNIVITGIEGELHQVGANLIADVLDADGWDVRFLGTNTPHAHIITAIETHQAAILGISATMLFSLPQVKGLIAAVRARYGPRHPRIVVGGGAFHRLPDLASDLGADGAATDARGVSALMQAMLDGGLRE